jgi:YidC/Oxa1 family membrane protein insertase
LISSAPAQAARVAIDTNAPEQLVVITNENARYTFTSHGGGLKLVELIDYPEEVRRKRGEEDSARLATLNRDGFLPTLAVLDGETVQGNGIFQLSATGNVVRAEKLLPGGLSIVKEFALSTNYLVSATVRLQNQSTQALTLPEQRWVVGTATPMNNQDQGGSTVGWMWYDGDDASYNFGASFFSRRNFACMARTPPESFIGGQSNVVWAAVFNQFFTLAAIPQEPAARVVAREIDLPPPTAEELREDPGTIRDPKGYETYLVYPGLTLAPDQAVTRQFRLYAGPKEYRTLARLGQELDSIMNFGWFGFFSKALLLGMNKLHEPVGFSYGWAIIVITIIIKLLFWPLTQASTRSMKRMQALQPQM